MRSTANRAALALAAAVAAGCAVQQAEPDAGPPYKPVASVLELMESIIAHAAEEYWSSVSIVVGEGGATENFPETDEEWEAVWAAGLSLAESGNLLMMPPRAVDEADWMRYSGALVEIGVEAAAAAEARDADAVLAVGERIYNVCLNCHAQYVPELSGRVGALGRAPLVPSTAGPAGETGAAAAARIGAR